jgi:hypothetical protein
MFQSLALHNNSHVGLSLSSLSFNLVIAMAPSKACMREGPAPARSSPPFAKPLGCWEYRQPDWIFVSHELKRIAIADFTCRPSDVHPDQLKAAAIRKQEGYRPLLSALHHYTDQGWTVHIFPWVVGIRGLIDPSCIVSFFTFLDVSRKHHKTAIERTVLASVKVLYFMHQVRFGGMHDRHRFADNPRNDSSDEDATDDEDLRSDPYGRRRNRLAKTACRATS